MLEDRSMNISKFTVDNFRLYDFAQHFASDRTVWLEVKHLKLLKFKYMSAVDCL